MVHLEFQTFSRYLAPIRRRPLPAIIMENFSLFYTMDEDTKMGYNDVHAFQLLWNKYDNKRKGTLPVKKVIHFRIASYEVATPLPSVIYSLILISNVGVARIKCAMGG